MTATTGTARPGDLRNAMVDRLVAAGRVSRPEVERALRMVPRHLFVPAVGIAAAYVDDTVTIKPGPAGGRPISCISQPTVVATMLDQANLQAGDNVLEIGAGTGYTSALISEIVGSGGKVTTIDVDRDVTAHARGALASADYDMVTVVDGDGALGRASGAPYDAIIVSVGPWDLPHAWADQLVDGGTLIVPLGWRGQSRSVLFHKVDGHFRAVDSAQCGFIPMRGSGQNGERTGQITDEVALHADRDQHDESGGPRRRPRLAHQIPTGVRQLLEHRPDARAVGLFLQLGIAPRRADHLVSGICQGANGRAGVSARTHRSPSRAVDIQFAVSRAEMAGRVRRRERDSGAGTWCWACRSGEPGPARSPRCRRRAGRRPRRGRCPQRGWGRVMDAPVRGGRETW
jgi:protein-L-isoaspartate(D-aspartate) O-methyltransferase